MSTRKSVINRLSLIKAAVMAFSILALSTNLASTTAQAVTSIERVSVASNGAQASGYSGNPVLSADGRFVAFNSGATNLVTGDTNGTSDIFVHDRQTGQTTRVSVASNGAQANGLSDNVALSADGRFVAFGSLATNLVASDTNGFPDIFVHDRQTGQTTRVSVASNGAQANGPSGHLALSPDGRFVAFNSGASNLVAGDTNGLWDIFVHDRDTGQTTRVSVTSNGAQANGWSGSPVLSVDGRFVAFQSWATNLVADDTNGTWDIFAHDRQTGQTTRVSVASDGAQANGSSEFPALSADGRFVAFESDATNLVAGDSNGAADVFVHDRQTGQTTRVSVASNGAQANGLSDNVALSADGRFVAFGSLATNLVAGDTNSFPDIFVHDRQTGQTTRVSVVSDGAQANGPSGHLALSPDGRFVAFSSEATNLVAGDTNGTTDVFVAAVPAAALVPSVSHIEVTQVIQDQSNEVLLIAGKPTFVRVYVDCGAGCAYLRNVTGVLRAYDAASGIEKDGSPIMPVNLSITAYHPTNWQSQRGDLSKTLNFTLPTGWLSGQVRFRAEVEGAALEDTRSFESARSINIVYVPVRDVGHEPSLAAIQDAHKLAARWYPTSQLNYVPLPTWTWNRPVRCARYLWNTDLFNDCLMKDLKNDLTDLYRQGKIGGYIFGWLPTSSNLGVLGSSDPRWPDNPEGQGKAAFGVDHPTENPKTFVHEMGHLLGRRHTNTVDNLNHPNTPESDLDDHLCTLNNKPMESWYSNSGGTEEQWRANVDLRSDWVNHPDPPDPPPFSNSFIRDYGLAGYGFGWLVSSNSAVKRPNETYDYMSYCGSVAAGNVWTSSWTYTRLYEEFFNPAMSSMAQAAGVGPYIVVSGLVFTDDTAELNPIWMTDSPDDNLPSGGQYCVEAQNASGAVLSSYCFDLTFLNYETGQATEVDGFNIVLSYPADVARIVLKKGSIELAVQTVSSNAPSVTVVYPNGGESWASSSTYTVTWMGSDSDGDPLTYSVLYSPDGIGWVPLATDLAETQLAVNTAQLAGSSSARVRVMATDGVNTSTDDSDAVFTVGRKGPQVSIVSPEGNQTIEVGSTLLLQGTAYDLEDGTLTGASLTWTSNRDGNLGLGEAILAALSLGQHIITLTAIDSNGNPGTDTITITVQQTVSQPPSTAPVLVAPGNVSFSNDSTPAFSWNEVSKADAYRIQIDNNANFSSPYPDEFVGDLNYETSALADGLYYWRVRALSAVGDSPWSSARSLTVDTLPPASPVLTAPSDGAITTNSRPAFSWNAVSGTARYEVLLDTVNPPVVKVADSAAVTYTPPAPLLITTYYWQVRAIDAAGNISEWSGLRSVTIQSSANAAPQRNYFTTSTPTLTWNRVTGAAEYEIQVDNATNFALPLVFTTTVPANTLKVTTTSLPDGQYYWRVRAKNGSATGSWSAIDSFIVDLP